MFDASLNMRNHDVLRALGVARQRAFQQCLVLARSNLAAEHHRDHLVAQIAVIDRGMGIEQHVRPAGRNQRVVKVPIAALPEFLIAVAARQHAPLHHGELVMRGNDAAFPIEIAGGKGLRDGMIFQQQPQRGHLLELIGGNRRDLEATLAFGHDQAFR